MRRGDGDKDGEEEEKRRIGQKEQGWRGGAVTGPEQGRKERIQGRRIEEKEETRGGVRRREERRSCSSKEPKYLIFHVVK